jgi:2-methylisocitrate lyase-like PEP mutase family enzyme
MSAQRLRDLHRGSELLVMPNAWDPASAAVIQHAGAPAVATTSAGVAWSCGWPDGDQLPADEMIGAVRRILRVVDLPLTVDIEEGCSDDPAEVANLVATLVDAGVAKLKAIRATLGSRDLYINARTDVFLRGMASGDAAVDEVTGRAKRYIDAGTDGMFVPGVAAIDEIRRLAQAIAPVPLNVMLVPGLPSREELFAAGARRLSAGIALSLEAYANTARMAAEFMGKAAPAAVSYPMLNTLLKK